MMINIPDRNNSPDWIIPNKIFALGVYGLLPYETPKNHLRIPV